MNQQSNNIYARYRSTRRRCGSRRGSVFLYSIVIMAAMIGFGSLAVDYGIVQVAKTQLMAAVDAAARCGANDLASGSSAQQAQTDAIALAAMNTANGAAVTLSAADVVMGHWDMPSKTFTINGTPWNAVRVTGGLTASRGTAVGLPLAKLIGWNSCDVRTAATAVFNPAGYGVVGLNYINMGGNSSDSYWSTTGTIMNQFGSIASNGNITLNGSSYIHGNAFPGVGDSVSNPALVSGSTTPLITPLVYANGSAGTYATTNNDGVIPNAASAGLSSGSLNVDSNKTLTLPGGNYYVDNLTTAAGSTLTFTGPTTVYVYGTFNLGGNAVTSSSLPQNLKIVMVPDPNGNPPGSLTCGGNAALYAEIYAPQSAVTMSGNGDIYGTIVGLSVAMTGNSAIHYDIVSDPNAGNITLVQ